MSEGTYFTSSFLMVQYVCLPSAKSVLKLFGSILLPQKYMRIELRNTEI